MNTCREYYLMSWCREHMSKEVALYYLALHSRTLYIHGKKKENAT